MAPTRDVSLNFGPLFVGVGSRTIANEASGNADFAMLKWVSGGLWKWVNEWLSQTVLKVDHTAKPKGVSKNAFEPRVVSKNGLTIWPQPFLETSSVFTPTVFGNTFYIHSNRFWKQLFGTPSSMNMLLYVQRYSQTWSSKTQMCFQKRMLSSPEVFPNMGFSKPESVS